MYNYFGLNEETLLLKRFDSTLNTCSILPIPNKNTNPKEE
jgi:hypothetical protein